MKNGRFAAHETAWDRKSSLQGVGSLLSTAFSFVPILGYKRLFATTFPVLEHLSMEADERLLMQGSRF